MRREALDWANAFITIYFLEMQQNRDANVADFRDDSSAAFLSLTKKVVNILSGSSLAPLQGELNLTFKKLTAIEIEQTTAKARLDEVKKYLIEVCSSPEYQHADNTSKLHLTIANLLTDIKKRDADIVKLDIPLKALREHLIHKQNKLDQEKATYQKTAVELITVTANRIFQHAITPTSTRSNTMTPEISAMQQIHEYLDSYFLTLIQTSPEQITDFTDTSSKTFIHLAESITDMLMVLDPNTLEYKDIEKTILSLKEAQSYREAFENRYAFLTRSDDIFVIDAQGTIHEQKKKKLPITLEVNKLNTLSTRLQVLEETQRTINKAIAITAITLAIARVSIPVSSGIQSTAFSKTTDEIHAEPDHPRPSLQRNTTSFTQQKTPNALQRFASNITALFGKKNHTSIQEKEEGIPLLPIAETSSKKYGSVNSN